MIGESSDGPLVKSRMFLMLPRIGIISTADELTFTGTNQQYGLDSVVISQSLTVDESTDSNIR